MTDDPTRPGEHAVPARLRRVLLDALVDIEQVTHHLGTAQQAAAGLERRVEHAVRSGLTEPDGPLSGHCRAMSSAAHAAAAAALKVAEDIGRLR